MSGEGDACVWVSEAEVCGELSPQHVGLLQGLWELVLASQPEGVKAAAAADRDRDRGGGEAVTRLHFLACMVSTGKIFPEILFDLFDTDGDGRVHRADFFQGVFFCVTHAFQEIGKMLFMLADREGSRVLSRERVTWLWATIKAQLDILTELRTEGLPLSVEDFPLLQTRTQQFLEDFPLQISEGVAAIFRLSGGDPDREVITPPEWREFLESELFQVLLPIFEIQFVDS